MACRSIQLKRSRSCGDIDSSYVTMEVEKSPPSSSLQEESSSADLDEEDLLDEDDLQDDAVVSDSDQEVPLSLNEVVERLQFMFNGEADSLPLEDYIRTVQHHGFTVNERVEMVTFLFYAEERYRVPLETITSAVNIVDRYLSLKSETTVVAFLAATASLWIAVKMSGSSIFPLSELCSFANSYLRFKYRCSEPVVYLSDTDICVMEEEILYKLNWMVNPVIPQTFISHLTRFIPCRDMRRKIEEEAVIWVEVLLPEESALRFSPSCVAVASIMLSFGVVEGASEVEANWLCIMERLNLLSESSLHFYNSCKCEMQRIMDSTYRVSEGESSSATPIETSPRSIDTSDAMTCSSREQNVISPTGVDEMYLEEETQQFPPDDYTEDTKAVLPSFERSYRSNSFESTTARGHGGPVAMMQHTSRMDCNLRPVPTYFPNSVESMEE